MWLIFTPVSGWTGVYDVWSLFEPGPRGSIHFLRIFLANIQLKYFIDRILIYINQSVIHSQISPIIR